MVTQKPKQREAVFRAIADPTRREILGLLRGRAYTVNEIAGNFRSSRPAISKHLRLLRDYRALWRESLRGLKRYVEDGK
jgi:DNA-binding transcriptional ArsR family regulator